MSTALSVQTLLLVLVVVLIVIGITLIMLLAEARTLVRSTRADPLERLRQMAAANRKLVSTKEGVNVLADYAFSEAAIAATLEQLLNVEETDLGPNQTYETFLKHVVHKLSEGKDTVKDWAKTAVSYARRNKLELAKKLLGKINDLVASRLGGGKK